MSTNDDHRLGWEAWLILAVVAIGATGLVLLAPIGPVFEPPSPRPSVPSVPLDPSRLAAGISGAVIFTLLAIRLIRSTDWRISD